MTRPTLPAPRLAEKTKERADAAKKAMKMASEMAWQAFDAGKYEEAATWFAQERRTQSGEPRQCTRLLGGISAIRWSQKPKRVSPHGSKNFRPNWLTAEESKKGALRTSIDALEKIRYTMSYTSLSMLETVARENGATADLVEYGEQELELLHRELAYLQKSGAAKQDIDLKNVQIATALERIAGEQADMASFDAAEENYLAALAIRSALPEEMAERKLEDTLSELGRLYLHYLGDLVKARDYFEQALASMEASAPTREKALTNDPWTAAQKEGMTPGATRRPPAESRAKPRHEHRHRHHFTMHRAGQSGRGRAGIGRFQNGSFLLRTRSRTGRQRFLQGAI